ncbi:uncharacterized protein LOC142775603 isoform X1 [Rhipicephalus microplus]|uniref:uncharacterized protein LOC142775603 isoform X1 n=1 Tax=Rhipicephalus microplus TaxID=6941 RepID=UPI003F6CDFCA
MEFGVCFVTCEGVILLHSRIFVLDHFDCAGRDLLLVLLRKTCQEKICCHALFCHAVRALTNDNRSRWESKLFPIIGHRPLQVQYIVDSPCCQVVRTLDDAVFFQLNYATTKKGIRILFCSSYFTNKC